MALTDSGPATSTVIGSSPEAYSKVDSRDDLPDCWIPPSQRTHKEDEKFAKELLADREEEASTSCSSSRNDLVRCACRSPWKSVQLMDIKAFQPIITSLDGRPARSTLADRIRCVSTFPAGTLSGARPRAVEIIDGWNRPTAASAAAPVGCSFLRQHGHGHRHPHRSCDHGRACRPVPALCSTPCPATEWQETRNKAEASVENHQIAASCAL